jgi:hypothetical protein
MSNTKRALAAVAVLIVLAGAPALADEYKYTSEERIILTRDLTAEFATAKLTLPRSKKPLRFDAATGEADMMQWTEVHAEYGSAAEMGDLVQITKIDFKSKRIELEINGGFKGGRKWYDRIQLGGGVGGGRMRPVTSGANNRGGVGTTLALDFPDGVPELDARRIKELLEPLFDFEQQSAVEQYVESLPEPMQAAIEEERAIEGMHLDAVLIALGKPDRKVRETKDGVEYEDWIYGEPPGRVVFVTFRGDTVVRVREVYGSLGGTVAPPLPAQ